MPLYCTVGLPGAGKTTWANNTFDQDWLLLERDKMRTAFFRGKMEYFEKSPFSNGVRRKFIDMAMLQAAKNWPNSKIVLSDTGVRYFDVNHIIELYPVESVTLIVFKMSKELYLERNRQRAESDRMPGNRVDDFWRAFNQPDIWYKNPKWKKRYIDAETGNEIE